MAEEKRRPGAQEGNTNSQKGDSPATAHLHLRVSPEAKERYQAAAEGQGLKLTQWALNALDKAEKSRKVK